MASSRASVALRLAHRPALRKPGATEGIDSELRLYGVTCTAPADCWAVGDYWSGTRYQALIEHWDGVSWSVVTPSISNPYESLSSVTCLSASDCWTVGEYYDETSARYQTLIERWDGIAWSIVASPNTGIGQFDTLNRVTCNSASDCWAVGYYDNVSGVLQTLTEHWNGVTWSIVNSPNAGTATEHNNLLVGVACASFSDCWAAGHYYSRFSRTERTLIEHWNGVSWSIVSSPNPDPGDNVLYDVACASASQCWAVGSFNDNNQYATLIEKWDGSSWTFIPPPDFQTGNHSANAVTCTSASDCWLAGSSYQDDLQTYVERWNGTSWAVVDSPSPSDYESLYGVACSSASACWAVGFYNDQQLIERWDGVSWTVAMMPPPLNGAASRKMHGSAGAFDVDLPLKGNPGIECRSGGANGDYEVVFSFANDLASVSGANALYATVANSSIGPNPNQYTVSFAGVANAHDVQVVLNLVQDTAGNTGTASATMAVLIGDTNASGAVNSADVVQTKSRIGESVDATNFRSDVNANGSISATDAAIVKSNIGTGLP